MTDQWGRRKYVTLNRSQAKPPTNGKNRMLITGLAGVVLIEIYAAVMQRVFQNTDNNVGKGFAILGIYLFVVCYCELLHWGAGLSECCFEWLADCFIRWYA